MTTMWLGHMNLQDCSYCTKASNRNKIESFKQWIVIISNHLSTCLSLACPSWSGKTCNFHGNCQDGDVGNGTCVCDVSILSIFNCLACLSSEIKMYTETWLMTFTFLIERLDHSSSLSLTGDFDVFWCMFGMFLLSCLGGEGTRGKLDT